MPKGRAQASHSVENAGLSHRETTNAISAAIADTEAEILAHAFSDEPADADGDDSLEQMGDGLEGDDDAGDGDDEDRGDADDEGDEGEDDQSGEQDDDDDGEEPDDRRRPEARDDRRDDRQRENRRERRDEPRRDERELARRGDDRRRDGRDDRSRDDRARDRDRDRRDDRWDDRRNDRGVPPRIHAQERRARRALEEDNDYLRSQLQRMNDRLDQFISGQVQPSRQPQHQQQQDSRTQSRQERRAAPDKFTDPEGYDRWVEEVISDAETRIASQFQQQQAQQAQQQAERALNASFEREASGIRGYEFRVAFNDFKEELDRMGPGPQRDRLLNSVIRDREPGKALLEWWDDTSSPEYIDYHRRQILDFYGDRRGGRDNGRRDRREDYDDRRDDRGRGRDDRRSARNRYDDDRYDDRGYGRNERYRDRDRDAPRHEYRLPPSLNSASGGSRQHSDFGGQQFDSSDAAIMASVFAR